MKEKSKETAIEKQLENSNNIEFGAILRKLRTLSHKTFADIARANDRENGAIYQQIETGHSSNPSLRSLVAYAKGLGVPLSTLVAIWEIESGAKRSVLWNLTASLLDKRCENLSNQKNCKIGGDCFCNVEVSTKKESKEIEDLRAANKALVELLVSSGIEFDKNLLK